MKLQKVIISGFRSIKKEEVLLVDDKVTILIGANDHGKSNILTAIEFLNDEKKLSPNDVNWDLHEKTPVTIEWQFDASEDVLKRIGEYVQNEIAIVDGQVTPVQEPIFDVNTDNKIIFCKDSDDNEIKIKSLPLRIPRTKNKEILAIRPRIELFISPTTNFKDQVTLTQLETPEFEFMQGIFRLAEIWDIRKTIFTQNPQTSKLLDEASTKLTETLNNKWNQGRNLKWRLKHTGTNGDNILIEIEDPSIGSRYSRPSLRSSGFKTYFLLTMITYARIENKKANTYIYLFDEPGTYLHPHAQLDLQRSFETISDKTQIIYTTHSIFLINKNYPGRNRVISKSEDGTKIDQKPFIKNWKSVRDSLGILLSNNFLIAEKTLLVEGPSDVIYLLDAIKKLRNGRKIDIDLNDLSIVDAGNSENYIAMAKLMLSEGRDVVALLDGDKAGDEMKKQLNKVCSKEINESRLKIHILPKDKSTEDIFTNIDAIRESIVVVATNLINDGFRKCKKDLNLITEINKIKIKDGITLGRTIDQTTLTLFEKEEKVSKLSIALEYEDRAILSAEIGEEAEVEIQKIKDALSLKGEKNQGDGVFEEI